MADADRFTPDEAPPTDGKDQTSQPDAEQTPAQRFLDGDKPPQEEVEHPTRLMRIAHMVRSMLDEVRTTELDEAGRERLAEIHDQAIASLKEIVSEDLGAELEEMNLLPDGTPSGSELRVAQAQLAGWLEGLFRGIQASMATEQQLQQLAQFQRRQAIEGGGRQGGAGQYL
ncbi:MAG: bacterial proteasome activator family protein [Actinobacteria bacterium]|nr:bacterial proteasome activator family protein [Actinomycetota bacterium]